MTLLAAACQAAPAELEPSPRPETPAPAQDAATPAWEGALGLIVAYRPEYPGGQNRVAKLTPALFLRYGRLTITNAGGFVTRRADDVARGLALDLARGDRLRMNLSLRYDAGRTESTSADLAGLGDIRRTVRARLNVGWRLDGPWRLGGAWSVDALGRGGGNLGDVSAGWERRITPASVLSLGASVQLAGDRYMQTYYGVTEEQSARSGYPVYTPGAGLRDVSASLGLRTELDEHWTMISGAAVSRLLGPAARSPLTKESKAWGVNLGVARRF